MSAIELADRRACHSDILPSYSAAAEQAGLRLFFTPSATTLSLNEWASEIIVYTIESPFRSAHVIDTERSIFKCRPPLAR